MTAADLVARTRHPKVVAIGEAGLDYHYDNSPRDAQERGFRTHIAAARETGLPLVIHSREADDDTARILEEESGKGAFPAVLHCFTGGRRSGPPRGRARAFRLLHRHSDVQEFRGVARDRGGIAGRPHPGRDRRALSRARENIAASATSRPLWSRPRKSWPKRAAFRSTRSRGQTTANFFRLFSKVPRSADADNYAVAQQIFGRIIRSDCRNDAEIHHSRLRLFRRRAAAGSRLGRLRSEQSEKPPPAHIAPGRARRALNGGGATRVLVDTSPDLREQLLDAEVDWLDGVLYTHEHADHTHGIDDLRAFFLKQRRRVDVYLDEPTAASLHVKFGYCFKSPPGSDYPPIVTEHRLTAGTPVTIEGQGGPITALPFLQEHGDIASLGFRFGKLAYSAI